MHTQHYCTIRYHANEAGRVADVCHALLRKM